MKLSNIVTTVIMSLFISSASFAAGEAGHNHDHEAHESLDKKKDVKKKKNKKKKKKDSHGHAHGSHEGHDDHSDHGHASLDEDKDHDHDKGHDHAGHDDHKGHDHGSKEKHADHARHDDHKGHDDHGGEDDHGHGHGHGGGKAIGAGKAIVKVDEKLGFKLSSIAIQNLKLELKSVSGKKLTVASSTVVKSKNLVGVYRFKDGFFKFLNAKVIKNNKKSKTMVISVKDLNFGDQIVTKGVSLLRVSDVYSTDKSEYGHSH